MPCTFRSMLDAGHVNKHAKAQGMAQPPFPTTSTYYLTVTAQSMCLKLDAGSLEADGGWQGSHPVVWQDAALDTVCVSNLSAAPSTFGHECRETIQLCGRMPHKCVRFRCKQRVDPPFCLRMARAWSPPWSATLSSRWIIVPMSVPEYLSSVSIWGSEIAMTCTSC